MQYHLPLPFCAKDLHLTIVFAVNLLFIIDFPQVFGRGKGLQNRPGNVRFRHIVEMNLGQYEKSNRHDKTKLSESVMKIIQDSSGRFLKQSPTGGGWIEVEDMNEVRDKVSHAFRARRQALAKEKTSSSGGGRSKAASPSNKMLFRNM